MSRQGKTTFHTTLLQGSKTATGIVVPAEIVEYLGAGKKPPVHVTINGSYTYRSSIAVMNGVFMVGVSAEHRKGAGINGGDAIDVHLELDTEPRVAEVPADFQQLLNNYPKAKKYFDTLSYSNKQRFLIPVKGARTAETRDRRITKAISILLDEAG